MRTSKHAGLSESSLHGSLKQLLRGGQVATQHVQYKRLVLQGDMLADDDTPATVRQL